MNESGVKQQIVDNIQNVDSILVTVGSNPSVDELSAALGLTMYLNDIGKHTTAVVSGDVPPAINFLEPEKTFETSVDSLRDFVIALDKEKADHLRYKVEGDLVKIFITPYKTIITDKDLQYTQGDYNVEMVIALGVTDQDHLDKALTAHGKIFHDAMVATIGLTPSVLGAIDWVDESAGSLSEIVSGLAESLQDPEKPITPQVASALLTGIVAATERFSNDHTTSQTMSVAAMLMAAGANQQLIASKLREGAKLPLHQGVSSKITKPAAGQKRRDGSISIAHRGSSAVADSDAADQSAKKPTVQVTKKPDLKPVTPKPAPKPKPDAKPSVPKTADDILSEQLASVAPAPAKESIQDIGEQLAVESPERAVDLLSTVSASDTLADIDKNNRAVESPQSNAALDAVKAVVDASPDPQSFDPLAAINDTPSQAGILPPIDAPSSVAPIAPPPPPPMPDFSQLPPLPPPPIAPATDPVTTAPSLPPVAPLGPEPPQLPQAPLPPEQLGEVLPAAPDTPPAPAVANDPGQFKIPGQ